MMWTYDNDTDDGYVDYVYWDRRVDKQRLSAKQTAAGVHSLVIADAEMSDSGLYDCYDGQGMRKVGYRLIIAGKRSVHCS